MTGRLAEVEARMETVNKLSAVIGAMRGIAAARTQEANRHLESIRTYADTIGDAIGQALAFLPGACAPLSDGAADGAGRRAIVVFCAEQGFAGAFSRRVLDLARETMRLSPQDGHDLLIVGSRGLPDVEEAGLEVAWSTPMISHPKKAGGLAGRITEAIYERLASREISEVSVIHSLPGPPGEDDLLIKRLVPFDFSRFPAARHVIAPRLTLPPEQLFTRLAEEYVFAELSEAVVLSFAAENEARMRAMIAAHDNVTETLTDLTASARRLRQEEITNEIVELATGSQKER
ncbi:F0F1 ATP synthase subunit gamma [Roseibium aggregatum]|uniref:F0F1 ATP synthase subunit gamma n=1 Tax=Roseibium aggregatum TaxID=187304 RepID=A0A939EGL4_9HYPH|nr:FoF1 ATP synthase subunit gamma [Roseibium aggregatum]MBN9671380.1 F0F1 ATP synthase subunit gamma [Roseibium aggregatum]